MTYKDKLVKKRAIELLDKFSMPIEGHKNIYYKQCALIALGYLMDDEMMWQNGEPDPFLFWQEVKKEIEKL